MARRRASRITAPRVSRNPGLYAAVRARMPVPVDPGSYRSYIFPGVGACPTGPVVLGSRCDRRKRSMYAGASRQAPPRNEFQQVETRAGGPRPRHAHIVQVPRSPPLPRLASSLPIRPDSSGPHCFSVICCHPPRGDPDGSLYAARTSREQICSCCRPLQDRSAIFPVIFLRILSMQDSNIIDK